MTFEIFRTNQNYHGFDKDRPPCDEAVAKSETLFRSYPIQDENGRLIRQETPYIRNFWTIEIDSLEDLLELGKRLKEPLLLFGARGDNTIEIFDDTND